jgi:WD40 repeat protein
MERAQFKLTRIVTVICLVTSVVFVGLFVKRRLRGSRTQASTPVRLAESLQATTLPRDSQFNFDPARLAQEATRVRVATGPWKQVTTIESFEKEGMGSNDPKIPDQPSNHNIVGFIDNHRFAVADGMHPIRIFSADDGKLLTSFGEAEKDGGYFRHFVISSDGRFLTIMPESDPKIWDTATGQVIVEIERYKPKYQDWGFDEYADATFIHDENTLVTYRGLVSRGAVSGNLQVWDFDPVAHKAVLRKSLQGDDDARGLACVGPYLLLKNYRRAEIFDSKTFNVVLEQPGNTDEEYLFLDPPTAGTAGVYASFVLRPTEVRTIDLSNANKSHRRWTAPFEAKNPNDNPYQAFYTVSPKHTVIGIAMEGRVNFYRMKDGKVVGSIRANNELDHPFITFVDENRVFVEQQRWGKAIQLIEISTNRELAAIPEEQYSVGPPTVSPDGRHLLARRRWVGDLSAPDSSAYASIPTAPIVLWNDTSK